MSNSSSFKKYRECTFSVILATAQLSTNSSHSSILKTMYICTELNIFRLFIGSSSLFQSTFKEIQFTCILLSGKR